MSDVTTRHSYISLLTLPTGGCHKKPPAKMALLQKASFPQVFVQSGMRGMSSPRGERRKEEREAREGKEGEGRYTHVLVLHCLHPFIRSPPTSLRLVLFLLQPPSRVEVQCTDRRSTFPHVHYFCITCLCLVDLFWG